MRVWIGSGSSGELVPTEAAQVSAFDHGFTVGDGIFETMRVVDGRLFLWPWHLERLQASAAAMKIVLPAEALLTDIVRRVAKETVGELGGSARVRLTISSGLGPLSSNRSDTPPTVVCAASAIPIRTGAARLHMASWPRNEHSPLAGVKSTSYADNVLALAEAVADGAGEALFLNIAGDICEGTGSNVFIVREGVAITPPTSAGLLAGVTRRFVLTLGDASLKLLEDRVTATDFETADEVFITSSFQDVRAVCDIDGRELPVGPITRELQRRFAAAAASDWCWT